MSFAVGLVIYLAVFIILAVIGFFLLKTVLKAIALACGIMFLLTIIFGAVLFFDAKNLSSNMQTEDKLILLTDSNKVLSGVQIGDLSNVQGKEVSALLKDGTITFSSGSDLSGYSASLAQKDYQKLLGSNYKLILIDIKTFESAGEVNVLEKL